MVVFQTHSSYTRMMAAVIANSMFANEYRVMLDVGPEYTKKQREDILASGLFDEVAQPLCRGWEISAVEEEADKFLEAHKGITHYFQCVYSDRLSTLMAHRLHGKAELAIFEEGAVFEDLDTSINNALTRYTNNEYMVKFFEKYPVKSEIYDKVYVFDKRLMTRSIWGLEKVFLDVGLLVDNEMLIDEINRMFDYKPLSCSDRMVVFFASEGVEDNLICNEVQKRIIANTANWLKEETVIVKPHPGQDIDIVKAQFDYDMYDVVRQKDVPWELILINILCSDKVKSLLLISEVPSTAVFSTPLLSKGTIDCDVIILMKIYNGFMNKEMENWLPIYDTYDWKSNGDKGVRYHFPQGIHEYGELLGSIFDNMVNNDCDDVVDLTGDYFHRVGNLYCRSMLRIGENIFYSYYDALPSITRIVYSVDGMISDGIVEWTPNLNNIVSRIERINVEVIDDRGDSHCVFASTESRIVDDYDQIEFHVDYLGLCKKMIITAEFDLVGTYSELSAKIHNLKWERDFWYNWFIACNDGYIDKWVLRKKRILVFGDGQIGKIIHDCLQSKGADVGYLSTNGKSTDEYDVLSVAELDKSTFDVECIIITPMRDYYTIVASVPKWAKDKTWSLKRFTEEVLKQR